MELRIAKSQQLNRPRRLLTPIEVKPQAKRLWLARVFIPKQLDKLTKGIFTRLDTVLSFTLEPSCGGTILRLQHSGYKGLKLVIISLIMQIGWKKQLTKKLPRVLTEMTTN